MKIVLIVFMLAVIATLLTAVFVKKIPVVAKAILALVEVVTLSWSIVCTCVWIIAWAFKFTFTLQLATGIWVLMFILRALFTK